MVASGAFWKRGLNRKRKQKAHVDRRWLLWRGGEGREGPLIKGWKARRYNCVAPAAIACDSIWKCHRHPPLGVLPGTCIDGRRLIFLLSTLRGCFTNCSVASRGRERTVPECSVLVSTVDTAVRFTLYALCLLFMAHLWALVFHSIDVRLHVLLPSCSRLFHLVVRFLSPQRFV